jgi:hypothetical protein
VLLAPQALDVVEAADRCPLAAGQLGHQLGVAGPKGHADPPALEGVGEVAELVEGVVVGLLPAEQAAKIGSAPHGQAGEVGAAGGLAPPHSRCEPCWLLL